MHLKPTAGCEISILIFEKKLWSGGLYKYPMKNISRTAKFLPNFGQVKGIAAVGLRCIIPPRHLSQLKTRAIPLNWQKVGKNFAVLDIFFMGYL
jgi:hypothetical protein